MKTQKIITLCIALTCNIGIFAQGITNNGSTITIKSGTYVTVSGGYTNLTNGSNHGQVDLNGNLLISGNFSNQATDAAAHVFYNPGTNGNVIFNGTGDQHVNNTTANAYISFENVTISAGSNTLLNAGSAATVNGNLLVNGIFTLSSPNDESESGSLITNTSGTVSGTGILNINRYMKTDGRYVYFAVPVTNAHDELFTTGWGGAFNPNLYSYNETYNAPGVPPNTNYSNWSDPTYAFYNAWVQVANNSASVDLFPGNGYTTYNDINQVITFGDATPDVLNNLPSYSPTSITYSLNDGNSGYYDGWNLIGNPYPCVLDWNHIDWVKTNITNTLYMWDGDAQNYVYYNNGVPDDHLVSIGQTLNSDADARYIPAMQSFWVKAYGAPSLVIPDDARIHYQKDMYKGEKPKITEFDYIILKTEFNGFSDETLVRFLENATIEVDVAYDAYKMFPWNTPAMIYSISQNPETPVAINSLPIIEIGTSVPIGFLTQTSGTYSISVKEFQFDPSITVSFIDDYMEKVIVVDEDFEYSFTYQGGEITDRFYLFVAPSGSNQIIDETDVFTMYVWGAERSIHIVINSNEMVDANVEVFDILGKSVVYKHIAGNYNVVQVPGSSGTYIVKVTASNGTSQIRKVFIEK